MSLTDPGPGIPGVQTSKDVTDKIGQRALTFWRTLDPRSPGRNAGLSALLVP